MFLKSIEVYGFKSFAQKISFEFHNGITAIVGPNGSGKSNVADAVRWVLGEQSARQLRGGNMQDVIFSGTENRKPLSYASVAITLDNADHFLPVEYHEVTVTRRLYRSGESEYLINGSTCRLRDINEMFYDTGIGQEGYSIIGQGQIDRILSGKPEERRELFDEAAGIVKFKRRKAATIKKLEEERQNLDRVTDILGELTRQMGPLETQAETARIYLEKRDTLRLFDVNLFLLDYENSGKILKETEEKLGSVTSDLEESRKAYEETKTEYDRLERELEEQNQQMESLREEIQNSALLRGQQEGQINVLREQISSAEKNEELTRSREKTVEEELEKRRESEEALTDEREEIRGNLLHTRKKMRSREEDLERVRENRESCAASVEDGKNEIIELLNRRATIRGEAQRFDTMMEQMEVRRSQISQRLLQLHSEETDLKKEKQEAKERYESVSSQISSLEEQTTALESQVESLSEEIKKESERAEAGQVAYHREESRLESLKNLTERYEGYGNAIRRVMEQKKRFPGIQGVVADLIHVGKDYEIAIETALGGSIQNIVTDTGETARDLINFLKKNRFGRATFLPMDSVRGRGDFSPKEALKEPGVIGIARDLVQADSRYEGILSYLLGRVLVVDQMDHALEIGRKYGHTLRMVTLEGESFSPGGSMTGGAFKNNSNLLGRRREIAELEKSTAALKEQWEQSQKALEENRTRRNALRDEISRCKENLQQQYVSRNTEEMNLSRMEEKEKEIQESLTGVYREQEEMKGRLEGIREDQERIRQELEASGKDEAELKAFIQDKQEELEQWTTEETRDEKTLGDIRLEVSGMEQKESFLGENLKRLAGEIKALEKEQQELGEKLLQSREEIKKKEEDIRELEESISECRSKEEDSTASLNELKTFQEEKNREYRSFFEKRDQLSEKISLLDKEGFRLKSQMEKEEERQESRISYIWEEYEVTPNNAGKFRMEDPGERNALRRQISKLKDEIRSLGAVNVNAIEEFREVSERHEFLSGQYEDLVRAEASLKEIIAELDEGMRRQFQEKFKDIQEEFNRAFQELFGGGRGTLELEEDGDILEAGIRIISQPPGKKLQNMMQLSGGEKALTAIALLFAIQNLKPSPFCLLDEIEAALDDSNVGRFATYLQKLAKNTQFIIITHRRGTMNAADRLYGITMQEKGVSTLVSVDLVEKDLSS